ncbi:MAG: urea carboxylase-associated family protein [Desulfobacterales bacterium]|nr:MAG: urea carboxylase-associated family protein [Desulfobacterales bacterium]
MKKIHLDPQTGVGFELLKGQRLKVIDPQGEQVADLFAFAFDNLGEWLSNGRSFDHNGTIYMRRGHVLYSNRSNPMLSVCEDTVDRHDFLFAPCSQEMFQIQYGIEDSHPNCLENLAGALRKFGVTPSMIATPFNIFMNVSIAPDGKLTIGKPRSKAGDYITLRAEMDLRVAVAACSAGICNNNLCKPIDLEIRA